MNGENQYQTEKIKHNASGFFFQLLYISYLQTNYSSLSQRVERGEENKKKFLFQRKSLDYIDIHFIPLFFNVY